MGNIILEIWNIVEGLGSVINDVWDWMLKPVVISINWFKIPLLLPNGVHINTGITPIAFFGVGILAILVLWIVKALVPLL